MFSLWDLLPSKRKTFSLKIIIIMASCKLVPRSRDLVGFNKIFGARKCLRWCCVFHIKLHQEPHNIRLPLISDATWGHLVKLVTARYLSFHGINTLFLCDWSDPNSVIWYHADIAYSPTTFYLMTTASLDVIVWIVITLSYYICIIIQI